MMNETMHSINLDSGGIIKGGRGKANDTALCAEKPRRTPLNIKLLAYLFVIGFLFGILSGFII